MYALLTKQTDGSFDLPVIWKGTKVRAIAKHFEDTLCEGLFRHPFTTAERSALGLFPVSPAPSKVGMLATSGADTFDGVTVQETATYAPDPNYVAPDPVADTIKIIKEEAGRRILAVAPEWRQRNYLRDITNPLGVAMWAEIDAIRTKSNTLEALVTAMSKTALVKFDPRDDAEWA